MPRMVPMQFDMVPYWSCRSGFSGNYVLTNTNFLQPYYFHQCKSNSKLFCTISYGAKRRCVLFRPLHYCVLQVPLIFHACRLIILPFPSYYYDMNWSILISLIFLSFEVSFVYIFLFIIWSTPLQLPGMPVLRSFFSLLLHILPIIILTFSKLGLQDGSIFRFGGTTL